MESTEHERSTTVSTVARLVIALAVLLTVGALGAGKGDAAPAPAAGLLDQLTYRIRTTAGGNTAPCGTVRERAALVGVPTLVDVGGTFLPDIVVELVVVPGIGQLPDVLVLEVLKLTPGTLRASVEVVLAPDPAVPGRLAFGYDGCETGAPGSFTASLTSRDDHLSVQATTIGTGSALTLLGSSFDLVGGNRVDPSAVAARISPVPLSVSATVDTIAPGSYHARLHTSRPAELSLDYIDVDGSSRTEASARVDQFPQNLELDFSGSLLSYTAGAPIDEVDVAVTTEAAGERTTDVDARLRDAPATASLARTSPTRVAFMTPDEIGTATVRYSSHEPGVTPPDVDPVGEQYLVADVGLDYSVAEVQVLGLTRAEVDGGDPLLVDVAHDAGPFHVKADVTTQTGTEPVVTRELAALVEDLPATARVTFSPPCAPSGAPGTPPCAPIAGTFSYRGSSVVGLVTVDVTSTKPFVDDATEAHLLAREVPTGLDGRLDAAGKTVSAIVTGGPLSQLEMRVNSPGATDALPDGVQGVLLEDHVGTYAAFARISGLQSATVGWGDTQLAEVVHEAGPFLLRIHTDDTDTDDLDVEGRLDELPAQARFAYTPGEPLLCVNPPCGTGPTSLSYAGSAGIDRLTLDVQRGEPLFEGADELHVLAWSVPTELDLTIDGSGETVTGSSAGTGGKFVVDVRACSAGDCMPSGVGPDGSLPPSWAAEPDGIAVLDRTDSYNLHLRVTGLAELSLSWGDPVVLDAQKTPKGFDIVREVDRVRVDPPQYGGACPTLESYPPTSNCDPCNPSSVAYPDQCPDPPQPTEFPYTATLSVEIRDLPDDVHLEYTPATHHIVYDGSAVIDSITADTTDPGEPIVGRAHEAHLRVEDLPASVELTFATGGEHDLLSACAGSIDGEGACDPTASIGSVLLTFLSGPEAQAVLAGSPLYDQEPVFGGACPTLESYPPNSNCDPCNPFSVAYPDACPDPPEPTTAVDGLVYVDLPADDVFAIAARVTGLQSFTFFDQDLSEGILPEHRITRRHIIGELRRSGRQSLWVEMVKGDDYFTFDYATPPHAMSFELRHVSSRLGGTVVRLKYNGTETAPRAQVRTNIGDMDGLDLVLENLPAGAPAIEFCVQSGNLTCVPHDVCYVDAFTPAPCGPPQDCSPAGITCVPMDLPSESHNRFSMALATTGRLTINGHYQQDGDMRLSLTDVVIEHGVSLAKYTRSRHLDNGVVDSHVVYADTHGGTVTGTVALRHENVTGTVDRAVYAVLPPGFTATQRLVEVETEGVNEHRNWGQAHCPSGTVLEAEGAGIDFDVRDDICREP